MGRNMFGGGPRPLGRRALERLVGRGPALPRPGLRPHPPRARAARDGGRDDLPLRHRRDRGGARAGRGRGRRGKDVAIGGGADAIQQYLAAGLVDEMWLNVVPILLGAGARLFDETTAGAGLEQVQVVEAPGRRPPQVPPRRLSQGSIQVPVGPEVADGRLADQALAAPGLVDVAADGEPRLLLLDRPQQRRAAEVVAAAVRVAVAPAAASGGRGPRPPGRARASRPRPRRRGRSSSPRA